MQVSEIAKAAHGREALPAERSVADLTVVVVDWNLPDHTIRCVRALIGDGVPPERVVVVENAPKPENWSRVSKELPSCVLARVESNVGFARANNIGASLVPGSAYLLVNNDAFVHRPGSIDGLVRELQRDGVGIVVPRLLNEDLSLQPTVAPFTTPAVALVRASGLSRFVPNRWQPRVSTHWDHASSRDVQAAIGAVMLVEARVWTELGGLRETSFMYAEDIDLCWRARKKGWVTWFAADSEFLHLGGASSDRRWTSAERSERIARAEAAMIRSNLSAPRAAAALAAMRLGLALRIAYFGARRNDDAATSCRGFLRGLNARTDEQTGAHGSSAPEVDVVRPAGRTEQPGSSS